MKTLIITLVALATFIAVGYAGPFGDHHRGDGAGLKELLKLDDATAEKIGKLRDDHRKGQIALRAKLDASRVDFRALMRSDQPDEKLAMAKQREISSIREEIQAAALAHRFAVGKLLTPEQWIVLRDHRGGAFGGGMGGGEGFGMMKHRGRGGCCDDDAPMKHRKRQHREHREMMEDDGKE